MIYIDITEHAEDYELVITGHSGYAQPGSDIVCSRVTILRETLDSMLQGEGVLKNGECFLTIPKADRDCTTVLYAIRNSLKRISATYPKHVRFSYKEKTDG